MLGPFEHSCTDEQVRPWEYVPFGGTGARLCRWCQRFEVPVR